MSSNYLLDKANGRILGVCSGLANFTGVDAMAIRIVAVLTLLLLGPVALVAYFATGLIANKG